MSKLTERRAWGDHAQKGRRGKSARRNKDSPAELFVWRVAH
jgi:hypothetical protein